MKSFLSIVGVILFVLAMMFTFGGPPTVDAGPSDSVVMYPISADPCQNPSTRKSSAVISVSTGTTNLIDLTAASTVYICAYEAVLTGTTPDFQLVTGTTSTCSVAQAAITGVMNPLTGTAVSAGYGGTVGKGSSGGAICAIMSAATTTARGIITYVKQ